MTNKYDAIVVGAGAGGGVAAGLLAEAGKAVLLLERGRWLTFDQVGRDHLRNQRLSCYGVNAGPDLVGNPRVVVSPEGSVRVAGPTDGGYQNNAACVGSGTRVYGAQAWRYLPTDFEMASRYGVPNGSSLADWHVGEFVERAGNAMKRSAVSTRGYRDNFPNVAAVACPC